MSLVSGVIPEEDSRRDQTQSQIQQSGRPTVEHEMARQIASIFKRASSGVTQNSQTFLFYSDISLAQDAAAKHSVSCYSKINTEYTHINSFTCSTICRSFPGFFKNAGKNKRHLARCHRPTVPAKVHKYFDCSVSLLGSKSDTTPSISEELELMQAGLGKRTLSLTSDTTHAEVRSPILSKHIF